MRRQVAPPAGMTSVGILLPLFSLLCLLTGCGAESSAVPFANAGTSLKNQATGVPTPGGTAKKGSSTLPLAGRTATAPTLTPATVIFTGTQLGSVSVARTLTVVTQDHHPVTASLLNPGPFTVASAASCASSNAACTLSVTFSPTAIGPVNATLSVTDATNGLSTRATLSGIGTPIPQPALSLSQRSLAFAATAIGATAPTQQIILSNSGSAPLTVSAIAVNGTAAADYTERSTCAVALVPGGRCSATVSFSPTATGSRTASLSITSNASASPATVSLTGTGTPAPAPILTLPVSAITFVSTQVGAATSSQPLTLTNTGNAPLILSAFILAGADSSDYTQHNTCAAPLAPAATCTLAVSFAPAASGSRPATLQIVSNASTAPAVVSLTGSGTPAPAPVLSLPISTIAFNPTLVGTTTAAQPTTLTNSGNAPLTITAFVLTGADAADYAQLNTCSGSLAPGATCSLSVSFTPSASGSRPATLQIVSNASANPAMVTLTGSGTAVPANTLLPGANAYLPFTETTGTIAHDATGNGNDCTFGTGYNAPTWSNGGLQFNDGSDGFPRFCNLPASSTTADSSVMNSRTLTMCAYFSPVNVLNNRSYAAVFGGSTRTNIGALFLSGDAHVRSAYYMGDYFGYGGVATYSFQPLVGYHCVTYALGSSSDGTVDHFYIDGSEVASYGAQGTVWDRRGAGDFYQVGAIPWDGGSYLWGTVYTVLAYPSQLTAAGVAHNFAALQQNSFYSRGVGASSVQNSTTANVLVTNGDSLTNQTPGGVLPYPYLLTLNKSFTLNNTAIAGKLLETEVADSPLIDLPLYSPNSPYAFISNAAGINDINVGGSTEAEIIGYRATVDAYYKQQGFTVLSPTMVSSLGADTEVEAINAAVRSAAIANGYLLVDWANEPCLGAAGAYANPSGCTFFQTDGLHPSQAGENEMARLYSNVVNYLTGSTAAGPTVVTAASYTLVPADHFLVAQGTTAQTITLPDCYGWSATTPFILTNANLANPVMLAAPTGFTLNGGTAGVPIAAATTLQVYADILSPTASGCGWHTR